MLAEVGDGHIRLTFDDGQLEIMSPSPRHESVKTHLARLIEAYADAMGIVAEGLGSTTFKRKDLQKGLEPDECYYVQHAADLIGKDEIDLAFDPPPDLTLEVDIFRSHLKRQPIYAALGVPELWRFDGRRLQFLRRDPAVNRYVPAERSLAFPQLSPELIDEMLAVSLAKGQSAAVAELRRRVSDDQP